MCLCPDWPWLIGDLAKGKHRHYKIKGESENSLENGYSDMAHIHELVTHFCGPYLWS